MKAQFTGYIYRLKHTPDVKGGEGHEVVRPGNLELGINLTGNIPVAIPPQGQELTFTVSDEKGACTCATKAGDPQCPVHGRRAP